VVATVLTHSPTAHHDHATPSTLAELKPAQPGVIHLRDGEVVLYRRAGSAYWQVRYKLRTGAWVRESTAQAALENAIPTACELYDEARFRQKLGLAHKGATFTELAQAALQHLRLALDAGRGRVVYSSYISVIERYFLPYFGDKPVETLTATDILQFESWRNRQMQRVPKASTLNTFAAAWGKVLEAGVAKGWISERATIPRLSTRGEKSTPRPAFSKDEVDHLLRYLETWSEGGKRAVGREMRLLLRDYVEILLLTGIRHGTEAMGLCWHHLEWHEHERKKYLRLWVSGKTGGRWLIAKHRAVQVFERLAARQKDLEGKSFETLLDSRHKKPVFRFSNGYQPHSLNAAFTRLMKQSGLLKGTDGQNRTLYSLRHTYATMELLAGVDIHTLAKQLGNSAQMIEQYYSKLTATLAAERLA
jgi:integrase